VNSITDEPRSSPSRRRSAISRGTAQLPVAPVTESIASLIALVILPLKTPKMTTTNPAVITASGLRL